MTLSSHSSVNARGALSLGLFFAACVGLHLYVKITQPDAARAASPAQMQPSPNVPGVDDNDDIDDGDDSDQGDD